MRQSLATPCKLALTAVFAVIMVVCVIRLSALRYEAAEEIPWHFNGVPLEWSEQRWENCYAQLGVYALMAATVVVFLVLVNTVNKTIVVGNDGKQARSSTRKAPRKAKSNRASTTKLRSPTMRLSSLLLPLSPPPPLLAL